MLRANKLCHASSVITRTESRYSGSLQIGNPSVVAEKTNIAVVADFRNSDIAAGGQGAPLAPAFHSWMFGSNKHKRILINIGGIVNISILLNSKSFFGYDIGPGNVLLDTWIAKNKQKKYDHNGKWSSSGIPNMKLLKIFKSDLLFNSFLIFLLSIIFKFKANSIITKAQSNLNFLVSLIIFNIFLIGHK